MPELIYAPAYTNISLNLFLQYRVRFIAFFRYNSNWTNYSQPALPASYSFQSWGVTSIIWFLSIGPLPITVSGVPPEGCSGIDKNGKEALPWIYSMFGDKLLIDLDCHIEKNTDLIHKPVKLRNAKAKYPITGL